MSITYSRTCASTESKSMPSSLPFTETHWISKELSDLSKVKAGKWQTCQISIFWIPNPVFFFTLGLDSEFELVRQRIPTRIQSSGEALLTYLINEHMKTRGFARSLLAPSFCDCF